MKLPNLKFIQRAFSGGIAAAALLMTSLTGHAAPITEGEAHAIAINADLYFYPS
jgi:hypothetical protein